MHLVRGRSRACLVKTLQCGASRYASWCYVTCFVDSRPVSRTHFCTRGIVLPQTMCSSLPLEPEVFRMPDCGTKITKYPIHRSCVSSFPSWGVCITEERYDAAGACQDRHRLTGVSSAIHNTCCPDEECVHKSGCMLGPAPASWGIKCDP